MALELWMNNSEAKALRSLLKSRPHSDHGGAYYRLFRRLDQEIRLERKGMARANGRAEKKVIQPG